MLVMHSTQNIVWQRALKQAVSMLPGVVWKANNYMNNSHADFAMWNTPLRGSICLAVSHMALFGGSGMWRFASVGEQVFWLSFVLLMASPGALSMLMVGILGNPLFPLEGSFNDTALLGSFTMSFFATC